MNPQENPPLSPDEFETNLARVMPRHAAPQPAAYWPVTDSAAQPGTVAVMREHNTDPRLTDEALRLADPAPFLRGAAPRVDADHAALFNRLADRGDVGLFHYDCTEGCDACGSHVEAWCHDCDAPLVESDQWHTYGGGPRWFCECINGAIYRLAAGLLRGDTGHDTPVQTDQPAKEQHPEFQAGGGQ
jgi:hypothetical protein